MNIRTVVLASAAICAGAVLTLDAQQVVVSPGQGSSPSLSVFSDPVQGPVVKGMPYSAEVTNESVQTLSDGNRIVRRQTSRVYRDAEGRVRREDERATGTPAISISDPVAKLSWTLNPETRTARESTSNAIVFERVQVAIAELERQVKLRKVEVAAGALGAGRGGAGAGTGTGAVAGGGAGGRGAGGRGAGGGDRGARVRNNGVEEALPNRSIENLLCTGVRRTTTIAAGAIGNEQPIKIVSESWTSVDLQVLVLTDTNDPRTGRTTYQLSKVSRSEPDASLFKVPSDYTITRGGGRGRGGAPDDVLK